MISRFKYTRFALFAVLLAFVACADGGPADPESALQLVDTPQLNGGIPTEPTEKDLEFKDDLKAGTFTICKVVDDEVMKFPFEIEAVGPGVASAPLYVTDVELGSDECADVYTAPSGPGIGPDTVTMSEVVPEGWQIDRIFIWSVEEVAADVYDTLAFLAPEGVTEISGQIDANKIGCVVVFYNSRIPDDREGCTRTPGYWKTHPEAWPVDEITIGGVTYSKEEALDILWQAERGDKSKTLFRALVAAKLNMYSDASTECVEEEMAAADAWLGTYGVCTNIRGSSEAWRDGEPLYTTLDDYNNGFLECADHCVDADDDRDDEDEDEAVVSFE